MRTNLFFYAFDSQKKPGKVIGQAIRFETLELRNDGTFDATTFKILCPDHEELKAVPLAAFADCVRNNFPSASAQAVLWRAAEKQLPDDDLTVLIALEDGEVWTGFRDAGEWRYQSADLVESKVTHWAEFPMPPKP